MGEEWKARNAAETQRNCRAADESNHQKAGVKIDLDAKDRERNMRRAYPVILRKDKGFVVVDVPDFQIGTQGVDYADAIFMARDVIGLCGIDMEDDSVQMPEASSIQDLEGLKKEGDVVTLVDVDFEEYRRQNDLRMVKKNCTVPAWLSHEAEKQGLNFSALLQSALKKELKVKNPADIAR